MANAATAAAHRPLWLIVLCAGLIVGLMMGLRQTMGLYMLPITRALDVGREPFSDAMALSNIVWGAAAVFAGALADRYGAGRVVVGGIAATVAAYYVMFQVQSPAGLLTSGFLFGIGVAGAGMTALVGAVGRAAPPDRRTAAIAGLGVASGIGGFIAFPYTHLLIDAFGWQTSLLVLAGTMLLTLPMVLPLAGRPAAASGAQAVQTLRAALAEAFALPSFWLLTVGFFVCGFHVAFYSVHLPAFVQDQGLGAWVGVWALMAVGLGNIAGTWLAGQAGRFVAKRKCLAFIYGARTVLFLALLFVPITPVTIIAISGLLGLFWLSTVPLTSGMVATFFGTTWMSMLFGFVFLSHQLGSFAGLWLAGRAYDATHSYETMWWISAALGLVSALLNWPIREQPVERLTPVAAAAAE